MLRSTPLFRRTHRSRRCLRRQGLGDRGLGLSLPPLTPIPPFWAGGGGAVSLKKCKPRVPIVTRVSLEGHGPVPVNTHHPGPAAPTLTTVGPCLGADPKASMVPPRWPAFAPVVSGPSSFHSLNSAKMPSSLLPPIPTWPFSLYAPHSPLGLNPSWVSGPSAFSHLCLPAPGLSSTPPPPHPTPAAPQLPLPAEARFPQAGD